MSAAEVTAIASACISLVALSVTMYFSYRAKQHNDGAKRIADRMQAFSAGQIETNIRSEIRATRKAVRDASIALADATLRIQGDKKELSKADKERLLPYALCYEETIEDNLNAYDEACARYIDNKVDRERFKKMFFTEIANLVRRKEIDDHVIFGLLHPEGQSLFQNIWKVYREWHVVVMT